MRLQGWRRISLVLMLAALTPIAAHAQPAARCFAETGLCIEGRIREFWEQNGGLSVFGLPIEPQQAETIEGHTYQSQWFERNRLELHPEHARPHDVLLGRLGADGLAQQGRDWFQFPRSTPQPGCRFFAATGHNVCGDILNAWRASGIELDGRRGISEAESLALFGLPLGDAQLEQIEGLPYTVQWFERARFELHPENRPPYDVLLGRLGSALGPPLHDLFAQAGTGATFVFVNPPGALDSAYVHDEPCRHGGLTGLRLAYGFTGAGNGGWGVRWNDTPAGTFDASAFDTLSFWVRGSAPQGFHIGLKDATGREVKREARDFGQASPGEWRQISLPLAAFADARGPIDRARIVNLNLGFNAGHGAGELCVDDIAFSAPLAEIAPQLMDGRPFEFFNPPGTLSARVVDDPACGHSGTFGLRIGYSFSAAGNGGWGLQWNDAPAGRFDAGAFDTLSFWVRGSAPQGFQIGLKDTSEHEVKLDAREYLTVAADEWRLVRLPLAAFADARGPVDRAAVRNLNVGFNAGHGAGELCLDDLRFE